MSDLRAERLTYSGAALPDQLDEPWSLFDSWFSDARAEQAAGRLAEANAMVLATAAAGDGVIMPSARTVLLKEYDHDGLVFYTNYDSLKGQQLRANPRAEALFYWPSITRQVRVSGSVAQVPRAQSEEYFGMRPRESQLAALVSQQSHPRATRADLEAAMMQLDAEYADRPVPCPPDWGGYRLTPTRFEFWQGQPNRLHDRLVTELVDQHWTSTRLDP